MVDAENRGLGLMQPEKVKSRWRRNSELELSDLNRNLTIVSILTEQQMQESIQEINAAAITNGLEAASLNVVELVQADKPVEVCPQYEHIEENIFLFERKNTKNKKQVRRLLCECALSKEEHENGMLGCNSECLNRLMMIECGSRCSNGDSCSNKRFQKKQYVKVFPFKTEKKGWGLKALEDIDCGMFVIEYVGEVLSRREFKQRVKQYAREKSDHHYFMALKSNEIIDATMKGNVSRFINHSCDPNCETQKWTVNGELRIGFFTTKDVKNGEELTFDYKFQRYGREAQKCYCESLNCSGYINESNEIMTLEKSSKTNGISKRKKSVDDKKLSEDSNDEFRIPKVDKLKKLNDESEKLEKAKEENSETSITCDHFSPNGSLFSFENPIENETDDKRNDNSDKSSSEIYDGQDSKKLKSSPPDDSRRRKTLLPTPLTKEERRHLFAMKVKQHDMEVKRKHQENGFNRNGVFDASPSFLESLPFSFAEPNFSDFPQAPSDDLSKGGPVLQTNSLFPDPSLTSIAYATPPTRMAFPFPPQMPFLGAPPNMTQPPPNLLPAPVTMPVLNSSQPSPVPRIIPVSNGVPQNSMPLASISTAPVMNGVVHSLPINTLPPIAYPGQNTLQGPAAAFLTNPAVPFITADNPFGLTEVLEPLPVVVRPTKLPPNWKTAKDLEGNIYYYHSITRQTQWDPPDSDQYDDEDSSTPTFDDPKVKRKTTTAAADTSSSLAIEIAKKIKELFRTKMSSFVVQTLNVYRKPECPLGRITCTEDFKHLARKLTHFLMSKELKLCRNVEELDCNEGVKFKAKDFIKTYMVKFGSVYRKDKLSFA